MSTVVEDEGPVYLPMREDHATNQLFAMALPCPK